MNHDSQFRAIQLDERARGLFALVVGDAEGVELRVPDAMQVRADPWLLDIILRNLLDNAVKYCRDVEHPVVEVGRTEVDGQRAYFVSDNGEGFGPQIAGTLFDPFVQGEGSELQGHGVDLSCVRRAVERHGGSIHAESRPGEGATFVFTLPKTGAADSVEVYESLEL